MEQTRAVERAQPAPCVRGRASRSGSRNDQRAPSSAGARGSRRPPFVHALRGEPARAASTRATYSVSAAGCASAPSEVGVRPAPRPIHSSFRQYARLCRERCGAAPSSRSVVPEPGAAQRPLSLFQREATASSSGVRPWRARASARRRASRRRASSRRPPRARSPAQRVAGEVVRRRASAAAGRRPSPAVCPGQPKMRSIATARPTSALRRPRARRPPAGACGRGRGVRAPKDCAPSEPRDPEALQARSLARSSVAGFDGGQRAGTRRRSKRREGIHPSAEEVGVPPPTKERARTGLPGRRPHGGSPASAERYRARRRDVAGAVAKSQYGQRAAQNGMWTYTLSGPREHGL